MYRANHRNVQHVHVSTFAHVERRRKRHKVSRRNTRFLKHLTRCRLPRRIVVLPISAKALPDVFASDAGKPAMLINDEETGTGVRAVFDHRADYPGAGSKGGNRGVTHSTAVRRPCRKYVAILAS